MYAALTTINVVLPTYIFGDSYRNNKLYVRFLLFLTCKPLLCMSKYDVP